MQTDPEIRSVVVAGLNWDGESDLFFCRLVVPEGISLDIESDDEARHVWAAMWAAEQAGWMPLVAFDELSPAFPGLNMLAEWDSFVPIDTSHLSFWKDKTPDESVAKMYGRLSAALNVNPSAN